MHTNASPVNLAVNPPAASPSASYAPDTTARRYSRQQLTTVLATLAGANQLGVYRPDSEAATLLRLAEHALCAAIASQGGSRMTAVEAKLLLLDAVDELMPIA